MLHSKQSKKSDILITIIKKYNDNNNMAALLGNRKIIIITNNNTGSQGRCKLGPESHCGRSWAKSSGLFASPEIPKTFKRLLTMS